MKIKINFMDFIDFFKKGFVKTKNKKNAKKAKKAKIHKIEIFKTK
jgi:hypothetical protein